MAVIHVGIDLGSTRLRAAYSARGDAAKLVAVADKAWPWLLCEPASGGAVPVSFPSLKSRLGAATAGVQDVVAKALDEIRAELVREPGTSIGHVVIGVPARFFTTQRSALLAAAADAGLTDVSLITDSVAAVIDQTADARTGTYLVYGMGYRGHELGLVRAVRGIYRVLGYDGAEAPGGDTLDAQILSSWLTALGRHGAVPSEMYHAADWPRLRWLAEQVKWRLAAGESVLFPYAAPAPGGVLHVQFDQSSFNRQARAMVTNTLNGVTTLLSRAELDKTAIDVVVLAGGSTTMPALREAVGELGRPIATADEEHIARGALRHAHELGRRPAPSYDEPTPEPRSRRTEQIPANQLTATVLTAPAHATDPEPALHGIRQLIGTGRTDVAKTELRTLITEAENLLAELEATKQEPDNAATATDLIATARKWLENGNHGNAIAVAHMAWRKNLHDVDVFEEMLDLHCAAAMAGPTTASFEADKGWLICALHHDPTNGHVRELLAERNHLHGKALLRTGNREEARQALQAALKWSPDHEKATALLREFSQRRAP